MYVYSVYYKERKREREGEGEGEGEGEEEKRSATCVFANWRSFSGLTVNEKVTIENSILKQNVKGRPRSSAIADGAQQGKAHKAPILEPDNCPAKRAFTGRAQAQVSLGLYASDCRIGTESSRGTRPEAMRRYEAIYPAICICTPFKHHMHCLAERCFCTSCGRARCGYGLGSY